MIKAKVGGIILGGLAGYLILRKGLNTVSACVSYVCSANKWKNYYKYGKDKNMDPPERYVQYACSNKTCQDSSNKTDNTVNNGEKKDASKKPFGTILAEAVVNAINDTFDLGKAPEGAFKGQTEASGEDVCPECCTDCKVEKCPYENLRFDGVITEWKDHKPVAGRYPWNDGMTLEWQASEPSEPEAEDTEKEDISEAEKETIKNEASCD